MKRELRLFSIFSFFALSASCLASSDNTLGFRMVVEDDVAEHIRGFELRSVSSIINDIENIKDWSKVEKIDLSMNSIRARGAGEIIEKISSIYKNSDFNLKLINFSSNIISSGDVGFSSFKEALAELTKKSNGGISVILEDNEYVAREEFSDTNKYKVKI